MNILSSIKKSLSTFITNFIFNILGVSTSEQWLELYSSKNHSLPIKHHRAESLRRRTRYFSIIFGIIVPAWIPIDYYLLPGQLCLELAILRIVSAIIFLSIAFTCLKQESSLEKIRFCMMIMFMIPTIFFLFANPLINGYHLTGFSGALINLYSLLPFLVIASLSIFTLTIKELFFVSMPIICISIWYFFPETADDIPDTFMFLWLIALLSASSFFSSVSQMRYMISQVTRASYDSLTSAMTRRAGIEALELFFRMSSLQNLPLSLLFIDLDDFKSLNDQYGHDAGDQALKNTVKNLKLCIRKGDNIIRWGGEEFLMLLPHADISDTRRILERINEIGLGERPDGTTLTASMGMAEVQKDNIRNWETLVELADSRMYKAKQSGKNRCVEN